MAEQNPETPPETPPTENAPPETPPQTSWTEGLDDDSKAFVENKGFKEPSDLLQSYRNLEKLVGVPKDRLLKLPEKEDDENWGQIWNKLGTPEKPEEYQLELPENADEKLVEWAQKTFHELKVPRQMAEGFVKAWNERLTNDAKEYKESLEQRVNEEEAALKKEWGSAFEQNQNIADQAARKFELTKQELGALSQIMGPAKATKFLHKLGEGLGEGKFHGGDGGSDIPTPDQAKAQINDLMKDTDFRTRLANGEVEAKQKWDRLHKQAFPGSMSL